MKRATPMKRTPMRRGKRLSPVSKKTRTERWPVLKSLRQFVLEREHHRCQAAGLGGCAGPLDAHHVVKRSQGGTHEEQNLACLCRAHHDRTDWPYSRGRLLVERVPDRAWFRLRIVYAQDKWAARA